MCELNLIAKDKQQKIVLNYLQENVSEVLAEKINNGVHVTVAGKELISKKDLSLFMTFAADEARKLCEKGARSACVEDSTVFGWAIHYFEEDVIHGKLYNLDGTEYKKETQKTSNKSTVAKTAVAAKPEPKEKEKQVSFFDFDNLAFSSATVEENIATPCHESEDAEQDDDEEQDNSELEELEIAKQQIQKVVDDYSNVKPFYKKYCELKREYIDCLICYRLGDFYELFDKDAVTASDILNLTITSRDVGLTERVPLTGIPYHAIDLYVQKLSTKHKVLVWDNDTTQYLVENGQKIDITSGEVAPAFENPQQEKQTTPPTENNAHIRYLQSLVKDLRADV